MWPTVVSQTCLKLRAVLSGSECEIQARPNVVCVGGHVVTHQAFWGPVELPYRKYSPQGCATGRMSCCRSMLELVIRSGAVWKCMECFTVRFFSFIQQIFVEHLVWARLCAKC